MKTVGGVMAWGLAEGWHSSAPEERNETRRRGGRGVRREGIRESELVGSDSRANLKGKSKRRWTSQILLLDHGRSPGMSLAFASTSSPSGVGGRVFRPAGRRRR